MKMESVNASERCFTCENQRIRIVETPIGEVLVNTCTNSIGAIFLAFEATIECPEYKKRETR